MKVIKISDETFKRLILVRSELEREKGQIVSMGKVIEAILERIQS